MVTASQSAAKLTQFESKPKIGLGLDYSYIDSRPDVVLAGNGRDVLMPMGSVSIPFHNDRFEAKRQEEKLKQQASAEMAEDMRQMFTSEIAKAQSAIEYAEMNITKMENQKLITQSTLELMRTEYASEGTRFEELLRLEMDLIDYDLNILKSIYDIDIAKAKLKKYE
jgi:outer membrane protein TolC